MAQEMAQIQHLDAALVQEEDSIAHLEQEVEIRSRHPPNMFVAHPNPWLEVAEGKHAREEHERHEAAAVDAERGIESRIEAAHAARVEGKREQDQIGRRLAAAEAAEVEAMKATANGGGKDAPSGKEGSFQAAIQKRRARQRGERQPSGVRRSPVHNSPAVVGHMESKFESMEYLPAQSQTASTNNKGGRPQVPKLTL